MMKYEYSAHPIYDALVQIDLTPMQKGESAELHIEISRKDGVPITEYEISNDSNFKSLHNFLHKDAVLKFEQACRDAEDMI